MKKQPAQWLLSAASVGVAGIILAQSYGTAVAETNTGSFVQTPEQKVTTRQVAALLDRSHYLNQPLDSETGSEILSMYIDSLDPNHTLFLQSDVDEFKKKYADEFGARLKRGDLSAGVEVFERYRKRSNEYFVMASKMLKTDLDLTSKDTIVLDREKLKHFKTKKEQRDYWSRQLKFQLMSITLGQEDEKAKEKVFLSNPDITRGQDLVRNDKRTPSEILQNRLSRQQEQSKRLKDDEIMETILNTAMLTYDPHSNYYAPVQANELQIQSSLQLEGIGVSIRPDRKNPDYTRIVTLVDGGPAAKSGQIKPNDLIVGIAKDGETMTDVVGWSTREIVSLIRGKRGTSVTLKLRQPNTPDASARNVTVVRDIIQQEESGVTQRIVEVQRPNIDKTPKRIGVLEIPSFYLNYRARRNGENYRSVSIDTEKALKELNKENIDGLVVDLRNNPGGSLDEVAKMLGFFIKSGPMVQIRDNRGNIQVYRDDDGGEQLYDGKVVVLTNLASASASEIFAAAIQDYGRGLVVGSTTTGKGSAQIQLDSLALGSATLTQRKFYRITGGSTQNKGVVPDVELVNIYDDATFGERAQKKALPWDTIKTAPYKPEGKFSDDTLATLNQQSKIRQQKNPQFTYLSTLNDIRDMDDEKKAVNLDINSRRAKMQLIEKRSLEAENKRLIASGERPYSNWNTYQAAMDAKFEERSQMKANERPELPEDEVFINEAAYIMLSAEPKELLSPEEKL
ncbi:carboxy terminal-processing peptidase [Psychrobacter sp. AOP22-C1-22]|uniref:carboxy terminal-processing peptidase n=1 Tax=unclassified Psychrobacter TaxID=196806 RepID=UPI001788597C|nr:MULTISPECIES: carboxy terminal-processing peptidase [unclassified Psychrobacter]MBE0405590.1 carboxy terminal-processing peptidase [Psychrobacter sp. FME6]MBE0445194.1 carboxy terminal-processing peptidase [Psychrobacter sp. FME5]MDN5801300.1 carboxy terminal-processing peptidase [Psychrobacter sp.]